MQLFKCTPFQSVGCGSAGVVAVGTLLTREYSKLLNADMQLIATKILYMVSTYQFRSLKRVFVI